MARRQTDMGAFWRGLERTFFWSYERMSWPYDLMVLAIVLFVMLTPRSWFHDQPVASVSTSSHVELISEDATGGTRTYRLDATVLPLGKRATQSTPELEREMHDVLGRTVQELEEHTFEVRRIDVARAVDGEALYYDVTIEPQ
jgi:hypothetical protein